jgi:phosphomannomutase
MTSRDLSPIFKAYDIRGVYPSQIDEDAARRIGWAFAHFLGLPPEVVLGRDMRTSSPTLAQAFIDGATAAGVSVTDLGEVSTDALYFASGRMEAPGAMFTASHNPAKYNGLKLCKAKAAPIGEDSGLTDIRDLAGGTEAGEASKRIEDGSSEATGEVRSDPGMLAAYADHCRSFVDPDALRPLKVAIDAGNGMAGKTVPIVFDVLPLEVSPLYFELDGTFPNHPANPIEEANLADLRAAVTEGGCDLGIAFDGDADRMFLIDEKGEPVSGSATTALVAASLLKKNPGQMILYNLICSWTVPEVVKENGGVPMRTRVGHSFIKEIMAETGAIFGGEHSGHYYFRDNFRADSGMIAALIALETLSQADVPLSELLSDYDRYAASGEINSEVADQDAVLAKLTETYSDGAQDRSDGLTVEFDDWWFNCRASNTEPLLRLNLEARDRGSMESKTAEVLAIIRGGG